MVFGITGANGVLGRLIVDKLIDEGLMVSTYDYDIRNCDALADWIIRNNITNLVHLASKVAVTEVNKSKELAYDVNVGGTIQLIKAIALSKMKLHVFFASTSHVYKSKKRKIKETDLVDPINSYGLTKSLAEKILLDIANSKNYKLCIGRIFSFYHISQKKPYLYPSILERLENENLDLPFLLHGADSKRDFLEAQQVVDIIFRLSTTNYEGIINIGSGNAIKISDFVKSLSNCELNIEKYPSEVANCLVADVSKLKKFLDDE